MRMCFAAAQNHPPVLMRIPPPRNTFSPLHILLPPLDPLIYSPHTQTPSLAPPPFLSPLGTPGSSISQMEWHVRSLLNDDTSAISTLRCLKIYLERLGLRYLDKQ